MINSSSSIQPPSISLSDSSSALSNHSPLSIGKDAYTDLSSLKKINQMADTDKSTALKELSKQFESIFINLMLKTMRESNAVFEEGGLFNSSEMKFHRESFDNQLALNLSNQGGIGLADAFYQQMHRQYDASQSEGSDVKSIEKTAVTEAFTLDPKSPMKDLEKYFNQSGQPFSIGNDARLLHPVKEAAFDKVKASVIGEGLTSIEMTDSKNTVASKTNAPAFDDHFKTPETFVESIYPFAKKASEKLGIDPKVLVAQAALETGWGKHVISNRQGESSNNLFNIKADHRWDGDRVSVSTVEYRDGIAKKESANFRHYNSLVDSFNDYVSFIETQPRYQQALQTSTPKDYVQSLQESGYATDPNYAKKIMNIFNGETIQSAGSVNIANQYIYSDKNPEG
ncbi:MAG: flagellar assembly peptidoglycan hydrolase FlgJ [Cellvibrionaceae bacterium]